MGLTEGGQKTVVKHCGLSSAMDIPGIKMEFERSKRFELQCSIEMDEVAQSLDVFTCSNQDLCNFASHLSIPSAFTFAGLLISAIAFKAF